MGNCVSQKALSASISLPTVHNFHDIDRNVPQSTATGGPADGVFRVSAVNRRGKTITGTLQVTDTEIILRRPHHEPIRWPLHFLRRYGFEDGVFSFESGRRCSSGEGVFTFRCSSADELFQLVQMRIQDNATATQFSSSVTPLVMRERAMSASQHVESPTHPAYGFFPRALGARPPPSHRHSSEGANSYVHPNSDRRSPRLSDPDDSRALVDLRAVELRRPHSVAAADSPFPEEDEVFRGPPTPPQHAYINIAPVASPAKSATSAATESSDRLGGGMAGGIAARALQFHGRSVSDGSTSIYAPDYKQYVNLRDMVRNAGETTPPLLDYAFVNLGTPGPCSSPAANSVRCGSLMTPTSAGGKHDLTAATHNYARIDLEKTKALEQTANGRRHRHDSNATTISFAGIRDVC
uniref:IRS-type PTB domain-containing protein n=1 Tax=Plectus sambesii TaxID=2011161 RepID=A0A914WRX6_9BILA